MASWARTSLFAFRTQLIGMKVLSPPLDLLLIIPFRFNCRITNLFTEIAGFANPPSGKAMKLACEALRRTTVRAEAHSFASQGEINTGSSEHSHKAKRGWGIKGFRMYLLLVESWLPKSTLSPGSWSKGSLGQMSRFRLILYLVQLWDGRGWEFGYLSSQCASIHEKGEMSEVVEACILLLIVRKEKVNHKIKGSLRNNHAAFSRWSSKAQIQQKGVNLGFSTPVFFVATWQHGNL